MQLIQRDGKIRGKSEVLKMDSFLNHQMDVAFLEEIGREFRRRFAGCQVDRILTIEAVSYTHLTGLREGLMISLQSKSPRSRP